MNKRFLFLFAISTFVLMLVWLATNAYHSQATSTIEPLLQAQIEAINPSFDQSAINNLKKRKQIVPLNSSPVTTTTEEESEEQVPISNGLEGTEALGPTSIPAPSPTITPIEDVFEEEAP